MRNIIIFKSTYVPSGVVDVVGTCSAAVRFPDVSAPPSLPSPSSTTPDIPSLSVVAAANNSHVPAVVSSSVAPPTIVTNNCYFN